VGSESIGVGDDDGGGEGSENMYKGGTEPVLVSLSDLYSKDNEISVCDSRFSSYLAYTFTGYLVY